MKSPILPLYLFVLCTFYSCVNQVPNIVVDQTNLVIFGNVYYPPSRMNLNIFHTSNTQTYNPREVTNASIRLYSSPDDGSDTSETLVSDAFTFISAEEGYESASDIPAQIGHWYWIEVEIPGTPGVFRSSRIQMVAPIAIKTVERKNGGTRMTFADPKNEANQYVASFHFFQGNEEVGDEFQAATDVLFDGNTEAYLEVFNSPGNRVQTSLNHLDPEVYEFYLRYNRQRELNEGFDDESGDPGLLFREPPVQLEGNIYNNQSEQMVLGNFGVIAISEKEVVFED